MFGKKFCFRQNMPGFIKERATGITHDSQIKDLSLFASGQKAVILGSLSGKKACSKLESLGLLPGTEVKILVNPGHGPLLVQVESSRITLGRGLATSIQAYG
jgi:ferrous iron transport protein A